jgi:hypothetical protein
MSAQMMRREFITLLGGAAVWPLPPARSRLSLMRCPALRFLWIVERHFCELGVVDV